MTRLDDTRFLQLVSTSDSLCSIVQMCPRPLVVIIYHPSSSLHTIWHYCTLMHTYMHTQVYIPWSTATIYDACSSSSSHCEACTLLNSVDLDLLEWQWQNMQFTVLNFIHIFAAAGDVKCPCVGNRIWYTEGTLYKLPLYKGRPKIFSPYSFNRFWT